MLPIVGLPPVLFRDPIVLVVGVHGASYKWPESLSRRILGIRGGGMRTFFSFFFLNKTLNSSGMCAFDLGSIARALVVGKRG